MGKLLERIEFQMVCRKASLKLLSFTSLFVLVIFLELRHDFVVIFLLIPFVCKGLFAELLRNLRFLVSALFDEAICHVLVDWF